MLLILHGTSTKVLLVINSNIVQYCTSTGEKQPQDEPSHNHLSHPLNCIQNVVSSWRISPYWNHHLEHVTAQDSWTSSMIGRWFQYKELELEVKCMQGAVILYPDAQLHKIPVTKGNALLPYSKLTPPFASIFLRNNLLTHLRWSVYPCPHCLERSRVPAQYLCDPGGFQNCFSCH